MRITKEMIAKLPKKKQAEFIERMNKNYGSDDSFLPISSPLISCMLWILVSSLIILPLWKLAFGWIVFSSLLTTFLIALKVLIFLLGLTLSLDIILDCMIIYRGLKIKREYFKIEVKPLPQLKRKDSHGKK